MRRCLAVIFFWLLPAGNEVDEDYVCEYLSERPSWED